MCPWVSASTDRPLSKQLKSPPATFLPRFESPCVPLCAVANMYRDRACVCLSICVFAGKQNPEASLFSLYVKANKRHHCFRQPRVHNLIGGTVVPYSLNRHSRWVLLLAECIKAVVFCWLLSSFETFSAVNSRLLLSLSKALRWRWAGGYVEFETHITVNQLSCLGSTKSFFLSKNFRLRSM